ncbi:MAG: tetratricopeptide repeat protein [Flavobacteriaceae bacterium]|nr:tetratricopeptide repeat protein [Flavobacteriaceae bacterium]
MKKITVSFFIIFFLIFKTEAQTLVLSVVDSLLQVDNYQLALKKLKEKKPQTFKILVKQGDIYQKTGNYSNAINFYKKALKKEKSYSIKQALGKSYLLQGNANQAITIYEEVLKKDSLNLLLKYELAKLYTKESRKDDAITLFNELIEADNANPSYYYNLGKIYQKRNSFFFMKSGNYFLDAYKLDSAHIKSIYELTKFYKQLHFKDSATIFIDKGLQINPKSINFNQLKAKNLFSKKEYDSTLVYLKRLENLNFKGMFTYKFYGLTYLKMEDFDNAEKYLKIARKINWKDARVLYYLGLVNKEKGDLKSAEMNFLMSMTILKPDIDKQLFELGLISLEQKNLKKAIKYFKEAYQNNLKNHIALFQLALASYDYYKDKKIPLKHFEKYIERFSSKDKKMFDFATQKIKEIKKEFFIEGIKIE